MSVSSFASPALTRGNSERKERSPKPKAPPATAAVLRNCLRVVERLMGYEAFTAFVSVSSIHASRASLRIQTWVQAVRESLRCMVLFPADFLSDVAADRNVCAPSKPYNGD